MKFIFSMLLITQLSFSDVKPNSPAALFSAKDALGKEVSLKDFKGKIVVLEWFNKDCPYVKKHYSSNNMQNLQQEFTKKGVVWLTILSSAPGKQGYLEAKEMMVHAQSVGAHATHFLLDTDGKIGKAFGAKTTPHMYVIGAQGNVEYMGAIDDNDSSDPDTIAKSKNYVRVALESVMKGEKVAINVTKPYGCSVKYTN